MKVNKENKKFNRESAKLKIFIKKIKVPFLIFISSIVIYNCNLRNLGTTDTITNENLAEQMAIEHRFYFDKPFSEQYIDYEQKPGRENLETQATSTVEINGKHYSKYPVLSSLTSSPLYLIKEFKSVPNRLLGKFSATFFISLSIVFLYLSLKKVTTSKISLLISLIYAFGSSTWVVSSQALWQHTTSQLFSSVAIFFYINYLTKNNGKSKNVILSGLFMALAAGSRITNVLFLPIIGIALLIKNRKDAMKFGFSAVPLLGVLFAYNYLIFGNFLSTGYTAEAGSGWNNPFFRGLLGLTFSPSVGIFLFSPVFLITLASPFLFKKSKFIYIPFFVIVLVQMLLYSKWWAWYGDSWAYRMLTDSLPYWIFLFIPVLEKITNAKKAAKVILFSLFSFLLGASVYIQLMGAFGLDYSWHDRYGLGHNNQDYLFNFKNSQLLYYLKRQRYYLNYPTISLRPFDFGMTRDIFKIPDTKGSIISFENNKINTIGSEKIFHAVELGSGVNPHIEDNDLVLQQYYDGISFFITPSYRGQNLTIEIQIDSGKNFLIKEIQNGVVIEKTDIEIDDQKVITYELQNFPEEIRIQNDAYEDNLRIEQIEMY